MKQKVVLGTLAWLVIVTAAHLHLNVGWERMAGRLRIMFGDERPELAVGFLPVT